MLSPKEEIETWVEALAAYDGNEFDSALRCFSRIADTSKILFNVGVINATLGEHTRAVAAYQQAVALDQYLAVAYFQQGVSNFLMGDFEEALANFNDTLLYLRGNNHIDYHQLGLKFKLYSCEVLFNRGLCYIYLQQQEVGMEDLQFAAREKQVSDHDVIDEAITERAEGYTVFSIPVGVIYRPNEAKVKNLKIKDYLGRPRIVAQQQHLYAADPRSSAAKAALAIDDRPGEKLSYAALNLVKPDLHSRSRQQSEPPLHRNIFPPTPPPETERHESLKPPTRRRISDTSVNTTASAATQQQQQSSQGSPQAPTSQPRQSSKPPPLELGIAAFDHRTKNEKARLGTKRSESERPAVRREYSNSSMRGHEEQRSRDDSHRSRNPAASSDPPIILDPLEAFGLDADLKPLPLRPAVTSPPTGTSSSSSHARAHSSLQPPFKQPVTISEESEDEGQGSSARGDTLSPLAFEIISPPAPHSAYQSPTTYRSSRASRRSYGSMMSTSTTATSTSAAPPPEMRKIRIKVHAEDNRYVLTSPTASYDQLAEQIRSKLSLQGAFKIKIRDDEGDMVTMADQDDWEMAVTGCRAAAAKERVEMGKLDIWVLEV